MVEIITFVIYLSIYIGLVASTFYILSYLDYSKKSRKFFSESELPSVSVLIPAYNEEKSIAKTIESILKIDYPKEKIEIIVINNNSKDKTLEVAKKYEKFGVKVYTEKKQGKGCALNLGISKAHGEIIFTMDADTFVESQSMKNMIQYFTNERVMAVTPTMLVHEPKNIWQRIQKMEYLLGVFLRKAFATLNAVYITPGAFSAYRKKFFDEHGGYDEKNVTEDIEMSLRIQYNGYFIDNAADAPVYTMTPSTFMGMLIQRRRWYFGYIKNVVKYRKIMGKEYGDLGLFIIPIGILSIAFSVFITLYLFLDNIIKLGNNINLLSNLNYNLNGFVKFNSYFFKSLFFNLITNPIFLFILFFILIMGFYLYWARERIGNKEGFVFDLFLFFTLFAILFGFWWTVSLVYSIFKKDVKWR
ncbi:MAG: glycosyltransferase family 2 protein [Nanoarchaeota archaeon]